MNAKPYYRVRSTHQLRPTQAIPRLPLMTPELIAAVASEYRMVVEESRKMIDQEDER